MVKFNILKTCGVAFLLSQINVVQSIYMFAQGSDPKCFVEHLPGDTVVVAKFKAESHQPATNTYIEDSKITVSADVIEKSTGKLVISQKLGTSGQVTFTTNTFGEHRICFAVGNPSAGWFHKELTKLHLNFFIGSEAVDDKYSTDKATRVQDMMRVANSWLKDILNEQEYQKEKESLFLSLSESLSSKLTLWIFLEILAIGGLTYWQINHLRRFFVNKKLV